MNTQLNLIISCAILVSGFSIKPVNSLLLWIVVYMSGLLFKSNKHRS